VSAVTLSLYLTLNFVISSLIVVSISYACKTLLEIYQGAFGCNLGNEMSLAPNRMLTVLQCVSAANYANHSRVLSLEQAYF
jgi:hypothetical protein